MKISVVLLIVAAMSVAGIISCSKTTTGPGTPASGATLNVLLISAGDAPDVNSSNIEAVWQNATALTVNASKIGTDTAGVARSFPISIKSLVSGTDIYFMVQYADPTEDYLKMPLKFNGGDAADPARWQKQSVYDDGVSFAFEQVPGKSGNLTFTSNGCAMLCHTPTTPNGPGMYSDDSGQYDVWYWHSGKSNGCGYADDDISEGNPVYQLLSDDASVENYQNNADDFTGGSIPAKIAGGNNQQLDKRYFVEFETGQAFTGKEKNPATGSPWAAGDRVPGYTIANPTPSNDYFDVQARGYWSNGMWTVKFHRKLNTGVDHLDTQFAHGKSYLFSVAVHDATPPDVHYGDANSSFTLAIP
ncbi:MAG TPA: ethylbenzene dehydrogenase-related protein [Candidatus Kapabacteria bacterium]|nr:ethylbenzene dehydrogenase-related protein [Candidatus Kapabacteria bacterium]